MASDPGDEEGQDASASLAGGSTLDVEGGVKVSMHPQRRLLV
jgi:hypothetical protein